MTNKFNRNHIQKPEVITVGYLGTVATVNKTTGDGEVHLTMRINPQDSWASITRALTLQQAVQLHADLADRIAVLRENGIHIPAPLDLEP